MAKGIAALLVTAGLVAVAIGIGVRASSQFFVLYGSNANGWGFTAGSESMPGPTMTVNQGDSVTIELHSSDGLPHEFFIDYNGDHQPDGGEPDSGPFSTTTTLSFIANTAGNFTYYCFFHPTMMFGSWHTIGTPPVHDIAVTGVSTDKTNVTQGDTVNVSVTVKNQGNVADTTTVTPYANATALGNQTVTLNASETKTLAFSWNTGPFAPGIYTISGKASVVPGETNTSNNQMTDGTVTVNAPPPPPPPPPGNLIADLAGKSAWPAHHHFPVSRFGFVQTFFGKVANLGPGAVDVKVRFTIRNDLGNVVAVVDSNSAVVSVGGLGIVLASWTVMLGKFHVSAQCMYDSNNDGTFDGTGVGLKTFSFAVVP